MSENLSPIGFWSYARQDDEEKLSGLRSILQRQLQQKYGREQIKIFQDVAAIPPGADWNLKITEALNSSTFLIPIITPNFLESEWCNQELFLFLEREQAIATQFPELAASKRIFPIFYIDIADVEAFNDQLLPELRKRQWTNFRDLIYKEDTHESVRLRLDQIAESIVKVLRLDQRAAREVRNDAAAQKAREDAASQEAAAAQKAAAEQQEGEAETLRRQQEQVAQAALAAEQNAREESARLAREAEEKRRRENRGLRHCPKYKTGADIDTQTPTPPQPDIPFWKTPKAIAGAAVACICLIIGLVVTLSHSSHQQTPEKPAVATPASTVAPPSPDPSLQAARSNFRDVRAAAPASTSANPSIATAPLPASLFDQAKSLYDSGQFKEALLPLTSACNANNYEACLDLGSMFETGRGVSQDIFSADTFYQKACDGGSAAGCRSLGLVSTRLVTLFGKSCDGGDTEDCSYLGNMYENGKGVAKDKTQAVALYRKACDLGDAWGCMKLKDLQP